MRLHTFRQGNYTLWADRLPVMHGQANLFTLWRLEPDGTWKRLIGGVLMSALRRYLNAEAVHR